MNKKWIASLACVCLLASSFTTVMAEGMKPGTYTEVTRGMYDGLTVDVTLSESKIEDIKARAPWLQEPDCLTCHQGKAGDKVTEQFKLWTAHDAPQAARYDESLWLIRGGRPGAAQALYEQLRRSNLPAIQRATLLAELANYPSESALQLASKDLNHPAPQVRESAALLVRYAKSSGTAIFLVGHVTKEGALAGPRVLEHMVDTVLYFEGDQHSNYRMIRAIKNRFGAANELGVFAMTEHGLKGVSNPSAIFLASYRDDVPGSCVLVTQEGSRPLLVEIQALVDDAHGFTPKRLTVGLEQNRLAMLLAVLNRHAGIACFDQDVFLNAVGGVKINEPAADLAVILAMLSSFRNRPLPEKMVAFGEIGLSGEVRPVARGQERLKEAEKLGFKRAIVPKANLPRNAKEFPGLQIFGVGSLQEAVEVCRSAGE